MNKYVEFSTQIENGFAKGNATFIIFEDLNVISYIFETVAHLHQKLKVTNNESFIEQVIIDLKVLFDRFHL